MSRKKRRSFVGIQRIDTVRDGDVTIAFGIYADGKIGRVPFAGIAKKNPEDKENKNRGRNFAIGRALEYAGKSIQKKEWTQLKRGNGRKTIGAAIEGVTVIAISPEVMEAVIEDEKATVSNKESKTNSKRGTKKGPKATLKY